MDKTALILTIAKDIYIARVGKAGDIKILADAVKIVQEALAQITQE